MSYRGDHDVLKAMCHCHAGDDSFVHPVGNMVASRRSTGGRSSMPSRVRSAKFVQTAFAALAVLSVIGPAAAQPVEIPATWGGSFWERPRLTGDWFGLRDEMGKRGVTLDVDLTQVLQGNATGGRSTGVDYDGLVNYELNLDTGKAGLWPGGFFKAKAFTGYGTVVDNEAGGTIPVNFFGLLTLPKTNKTPGKMNLTCMKFFTEWFGVYAVKMYLHGGDDNAM